MENEILYTKLTVNQGNLLRNKICEALSDCITNGEIIFDEYLLSDKYNIKGIKWDIKLTIVE